MSHPVLVTERLRLRRHTPADFDNYAAMWREPRVVEFLGAVATSTPAQWERFVRQLGMWQAVGFGYFIVEDRDTGAFLGEVGFQELRRDIEPPLEGSMEMGWALLPDAQGKGLALEAGRAAIEWAGTTFPGRRITALIALANTRSMKLAGRLGFSEFTRTAFNDVPCALYERY